MTQQEFEKRIGTEVSSDTFDYANRVYMAAGEMNKDTFCKDWRDQYVSESKIVSALTVEVEELRSALNASNGCYANATRGIRDFTSQMADFLIIQAATRKVSVTTYNQARMLVELINKAERRKARQDRKNAAL